MEIELEKTAENISKSLCNQIRKKKTGQSLKKKIPIVHRKQTNLKKKSFNNLHKTHVHLQCWYTLVSHHYLPYCNDFYVIRLIFAFF